MLIKINIILTDCDKDKPILKDNNCQLIYCSKEQFASNICKINNSIIDAQWLNRIIRISDDNYRFINIASNTKGDIFIETSPVSEGSRRIFYAFKNNGRPYFRNSESNEESSFYIMDEIETDLIRHESELINIVLKNDQDKEYLMSISTNGYAEIYDFNSGKRKYISTNSFFGVTPLSLINISVLLKIGNYYNIFFPICFKGDGGNHYFYLTKYNFSSIDISNGSSYSISSSTNFFAFFRNIISCFMLKSSIIGCFFYYSTYQYALNLFDSDLRHLTTLNLIDGSSGNSYTFFKGIYYKEGIIAFYYYNNYNNDYGHLSFRQINAYYLSNIYYNYEDILINKGSFNTTIYYNDFIKLNDNKLCIVSYNPDNKLFIITVNLYNNDQSLIIYYYTIEIYKLYNYIINSDVKIYNYNNFIMFCSSVLNPDSGSKDSPIYSTLIMFSYPNCMDDSVDLIDYLSNNNININNYEINLTKYFVIDNNIFGYILKYIKIINIFESTSLKIIKKSDSIELSIDYELQENEILKLFMNDIEISKGEYIIEYAGVVTEPDFDIFIQYPEFIDKTYQQNLDYSESFEKQNYTGKTAYYTIKITEDLTNNCLNDCKLCFININCIYKDTEIDSTLYSNNDVFTEDISIINSEEFTDINNNNQTNIIEEGNNKNSIIETNIIKGNDCSLNHIMINECNEIINTSQIKDIYDKIKETSLKENYTKQYELVVTKNTGFQVSEYNNQSNNYNLSIVDIDICEEIIKKKNQIPTHESLIIFKIDIKNEDMPSTYVQYEIYNPYTLEKMDLSICQNISTTINVKANLTEREIELYDSLKEYGYNYFDSNDIFYNDICSRYTTKYGTDIILSDRKKLLEEQSHKTFCQDECFFINYDSKTNMARCDCPMQTENTTLDINNMMFTENIVLNSFYITLSNSNFKVMKCYKLLFSKKGQINNYGSLILITIIIVFIILMILCFIFAEKKLKYFIDIVIRQISNNRKANANINNNKEYLNTKFKERRKKKFNTTSTNIKILRKNNKLKIIKNERLHSSIFKFEENDKESKQDKKEPPKRECKKALSYKVSVLNSKEEKSNNTKCPFKNNNINIFSLTPKMRKNSSKNKIDSNVNLKSNNKKIKSLFDNKKVKINNEVKIFQNNKSNKTKINNEKIVNEFEMNNFSYESARKYDKRKFLEFYWSILKYNHLILFIILPVEDYNVRIIKVSLLLISFPLNFTINGFFFNDDSMHKIYIELGKNKIINQLPQMIYSLIISSTINLLLKSISLSGKNIILIKSQPDLEIALKKAAQVEKCEKMKLILFHFICFIFLIFFWYFISCFCAVYINTQRILIGDTLISFATSMIYPFGYYLIPSILRIMALKSNKKRNTLYNFSLILS